VSSSFRYQFTNYKLYATALVSFDSTLQSKVFCFEKMDDDDDDDDDWWQRWRRWKKLCGHFPGDTKERFIKDNFWMVYVRKFHQTSKAMRQLSVVICTGSGVIVCLSTRQVPVRNMTARCNVWGLPSPCFSCTNCYTSLSNFLGVLLLQSLVVTHCKLKFIPAINKLQPKRGEMAKKWFTADCA